uniref:Uncharacterized protein n=1 Tax=Anguilla anguilla TaxID=7936 RepID=A0A0E9W9M4_ANGAN
MLLVECNVVFIQNLLKGNVKWVNVKRFFCL